MYDLLVKRGQMFAFVFGGIFVAIFLAMVFGGLGKLGASPTNEMLYPTSIFDFGIKGTKMLVYLGAFAAIAAELYYMVTNPKTAIRLLIGLAVLAVLFFIGYAMSSDQITDTMKEFGVSASLGKMIGGGIWTAILMSVGAIVLMAVSEILAFIK